jgi:hypothetical protein
MTISTAAGIQTALPGQRSLHFKSVSTFNGFSSYWTAAGVPSPASYPSASLAWVIPTNTTTGAYPFSNPGAGKSYLARIQASADQNAGTSNTLILYDRLAHTGAITPAASTQALTTTPLTRPDANGGGVELFWEWITASGATPSTFTCSYTNQDGTSGQTTANLTAQTSSSINLMQQFPLASGDSGVRSVESFTGTGAIGGTGMLVLLRRLAILTGPAFPGMLISEIGNTQTQDLIALGMPQIYDSACLALMTFATSAGGSFGVRGFIDIIQG